MTSTKAIRTPSHLNGNIENGIITDPLQQKCTGLKNSKIRKHLKRNFRIFTWISDYNMEYAIKDFIAGITLGLTIIPESIACALLAGLPARYGLCSAFIGSFIYLIFGSIDKVIIGPTSLVALVSVQFTMGKPLEFAFLLTLFSGIVQLIMGFLQLGFLFEFISIPVIKAFSSATAILVIESQVKVLLGIKYVSPGFIESIKILSIRISEANINDLIMGVFALLFLIIFEHLEKLTSNFSKTGLGKSIQIILRYLSFSRNTIIVLISGIYTYIWVNIHGNISEIPYTLSKNALSGLPNITIPAMKIVTQEKIYNFWDIISELNFGIIVVPIIGILTNISIGKLSSQGLVDVNQELRTVGICNIAGSVVQSMPTSGAFTRYAISTACGIKTPMANLYSGVIVLLALSYLSLYFNFIPEATLAAILMAAIFNLIELKLPKRLWNECRRDFYTWIIVFLSSVIYGVEIGLFVGVAITIAHLLFLWARPEIIIKIEEIDELQYVSVIPGNGIYFPAINHMREKIIKISRKTDFQMPIVIDCQKLTGLDYTAAQGITKLSDDLCQNNRNSLIIIIYRMEKDLQNLINLSDNITFCDKEEKVKEYLTQNLLRNGQINLRKHLRESIDLGLKKVLE